MRNENMSNTATISQGQEILALQDELTGALIGLARSCGNNPKTENTDEIIIEGLVHTITNSNTGAAALKAMIEKVREEKIPSHRIAQSVQHRVAIPPNMM